MAKKNQADTPPTNDPKKKDQPATNKPKKADQPPADAKNKAVNDQKNRIFQLQT